MEIVLYLFSVLFMAMGVTALQRAQSERIRTHKILAEHWRMKTQRSLRLGNRRAN